ncbi:MAG: ribosomal protein S18-alanine N-acetyltransferase [Gemmatimonadales bacterium]
MDAPYRIRSAVPADAKALLDLERRAFTDPWSEASFRDALNSAWTFALAAETGRGIVGYMIGREVAGTGEVLNLAVAPDSRRRGIAGSLLETGLAAFRRRNVDEVFLEVRESNRSAQSLYLSRGFRAVGQRSAYYRNPKEDALVLRLALHEAARSG